MKTSIEQVLEADCSVLLLRALFQQQVIAFGEDGLGKFGRNDRPKTFYVEDLDVEIVCDEYGDDAQGFVMLKLQGYNSSDCGHVATDANMSISIRKLLVDQHIDPNCLTWAEECVQGNLYCTLEIDVSLLLEWA